MQDMDNTHPVMDALKNVKTTVENFTSDKNIAQVKNTVKNMVKDAQKEFSALVSKDLANVKKKFAAEKASLDKEIKKQSTIAKKFIATQKKEVAALQARLEKLVAMKKKMPAKKKTTAKKATAKKATAKRATKKTARK